MSSSTRIAVIGGGIGGLSAAGELAALGHQVELFESANTVGGKAQVVSQGGVVLDTGPTLLTMPDVVTETFSRLKALDLLPRFHRLSLQTQYHYADGTRFDCFDDLERSKASVAAINADDAKALDGFYQDAATTYEVAGRPYLEAPFESMAGFMMRVFKLGPGSVLRGLKLGTLDALARRHFKSTQLIDFVNRFATYTGASPYDSSAAFAMIPHLERAWGVHHVEGGIGALVAALLAAVKRLGVRVHLGAPATWFERQGSFVAGPAGGEQTFDSVIVNADPMAQVGRSDEKMALSGFVFHVVVDRRVRVPHHSVIFAADYPREFGQLFSGEVPDDPTVYLCHPAATDSTMAPEGVSGLFVMVNAPAFRDRAAAEQLWPETAARLQTVCLQKLRRHFPELADAKLEVIAQRTPLDLERTGAPGGSIYGFLPHGRFGPFRRPALASPTRGVFFAGGGTHPGGGVPLVMLSGRFAAGLAQRHLEGRA